ncbi:MAG: hypothetical protein M0Z52_10110 [Actinomycetota bacterium]|nr:hypothetical protein [Actinomycetota bacterium]
MANARGKSLKAIAQDISEGYVSINPLFLKPFSDEALKELYTEVGKFQVEIRSDKFPNGDTLAIRMRNLRLQRLFSAQMVIRNFARSKRMILV